jgi:hypothetical protein
MWTVRETLPMSQTTLSDHRTESWDAARDLAAVIALRAADVARGPERRTWRQVATYLKRRLPRDHGYSKEAFHRRLTVEKLAGRD